MKKANSKGKKQDGEKKLRGFLEEVITLLAGKLQEWYPSQTEIKGKGWKRLNYLYLPEGNERRPFPKPGGLAGPEWETLERLLFSIWPIPTIRLERFVKDTRKYPTCEAITVEEDPAPSNEHIKGIARVAWLLFINCIPQDRWTDIFLILMNHSTWLQKLRFLLKVEEDCKQIEKNKSLLLKEKLLETLRAIQLAFRRLYGDKETSYSREDCESVAELVKRVEEHGEINEEISRIRRKVREEWKRLGGPKRKYKQDAIRYFQPLVRELFEYFYSFFKQLSKERKMHPIVLGDESINEKAIYRIIGDLIRFFFHWSLSDPITPPHWGTDHYVWSWGPPDSDENIILEKEGKKMRSIFGERIRKIDQRL